jgi:hypothetical protein
MLAPRFVIGFTGNRAGFNEAAAGEGIRAALGELRSRAERVQGRVELYTGIAEGADTLCVEEARKLQMPVHLLLPMAEAEFITDFSSPAAWERAAQKIALSRSRPGFDSVHFVPGETSRPECYFNLGIQILEAVDVLVVLWDGVPARGLGGTQQVLEHAERRGIPVVVINAQTGQRSQRGNVDAAFEDDAIVREINEAARSLEPLPGDVPLSPDELFRRLDAIAVDQARRFRPSMVRVILLQGLAALLAAVGTFQIAAQDHWWEQWKWLITAVEVVLVTVALVLSIRLKRRHIQNKWIRCRLAAEIVRGLMSSVPLMDPLHPAISRQEPRWHRFALTVGLLVLEHRDPENVLALRDAYIAQRLDDPDHHGQIPHYQRMKPRAIWWWKFAGWVSVCAAWAAPFVVAISLVKKIGASTGTAEQWALNQHLATWMFVVFLPIALPLAASLANGLRKTLDAGRRNVRYPEMVARLSEARTALTGLLTPSTIRAKVCETENVLLDELLEWQLAMKRAGR